MRTARVPPEMEGLFAEAEQLVSGYFRARRDDPERGMIEISGERYVMVRAASLSVEFFSLVHDLWGPDRQGEADDFARNILFDLAHSIGRTDARRFHRRMGVEEPIAKLAAGPIHFSHTGWAFVDIHPDSRPVAGDDYMLLYDHPYSFEATAWLESGRRATFPVCIMGAGYSSGWCEESFGLPLVAAEIHCRARGDAACRFIMAPPRRIEEHVRRYLSDGARPAGGADGYQIPDFFARKRIEEELRRARDDLERRVAERTTELERANERLREEMRVRERIEEELLQSARLEAIGRLAGGIAHDFNNLMGVVIGQASLLERTLAHDPEQRAMVGEIRQTGQEAAQLTQQLLEFSRAQIRRTELTDLNEVVRTTVGMLGRLVGEHIAITVDLDESAGAVRADRGQIGQVVMNLVLNARDAMPQGGRLRVRTARLDETGPVDETSESSIRSWAVLEVTDTGTGIDPDAVARIFDPFFTTKGPPAGTGLGLATVHRVVERSGGTIEVASARGAGTTFRVRLPGEAGAAPPIEEPAGPAPRGSETVLVVEDQPSVRHLIVGMLEGQGYRVLEAGNAEEALRAAASHPDDIDLVVTDIVMPGMNGRELAERLAATRPRLRTLFISGYPDDEVLRGGVEQGTAELLPKPFTMDVLARRVRRLLDR